MGQVQLWLDLDGTLLDTWERHWAAYRRACRATGQRPKPKARFKSLKRQGPKAAAVLTAALDPRRQALFRRVQLRWIEDPGLLARDRPFPGTTAFLKWARQHFELHLATARASELNTRRQLRNLGWLGLFESVAVTNGKSGRPANKTALARTLRGPSLWVGDTEAEAEAARTAGAPFFACTRGIRQGAKLAAFHPRASFVSYRALRRALAVFAHLEGGDVGR